MKQDSHWTVICLTFYEDQVLMMKRNQDPFTWAPPGGHLKVGESYEEGIKREVFEETGLECQVIMPVDVWQGIHRGLAVTNLTFVCQVHSLHVNLSEEHVAYAWVPIKDIHQWKDKTHLNLEAWAFYIQMAKSYKNQYKK